MIGVFVRKPYARKIVSGEKIWETRTRNTLQKLLGERVAIIETGNGKAHIVGYSTIGWYPYFCKSKKAWDNIREFTCIPVGDKYDNFGKGKWLYGMHGAEETTPYPLPSNAIRHGRAWCEFDI